MPFLARRLSFVLFVYFTLAAVSVAAQTAKLTQIKVVGSAKYSEGQIAAATGLKLGDEVSREDFQAAANRLAALGPFANVRFKFTGMGDTVEVEFSLEDAPTVPVLFDNFPLFGDDELSRTIKSEVVFFDGTAPEDGTILEGMTAALQKLLDSRKIEAQVERALVAAPGESSMIQRFAIVNTAGLKITAVQFSEALPSQSSRLQDALSELVGKTFSRFAIDVFLAEHVRPLYFERGNLRVHFGVPEARFAGNPNRPLPDVVTAYVPITPGAVYRWGGAAWNGNTVFDAKALDDIVALPPNETANGMKIPAAWQRVRDEYTRRGYLDAAVNPAPEYDDASQRVTFRVSVQEGLQYRMGQLILTGLSVTAERMLASAWRIPAGAIFDQNYFEEFLETQAKGRKAFGEHVVNFSKVGHMLRTDPETKAVDVLIDFQ